MIKKIYNLFKRSINYLKRGIKSAFSSDSSGKINVFSFYDFIINKEKTPFSKEEYSQLDNTTYTLNWVIPEMGVGSGGHINIFRFIVGLQKLGLKNRIYIVNPDVLKTDALLQDFLKQHYNDVLNHGIDLYVSADNMLFAHATIATSWSTAYCVNNFDNTLEKFYFVQDFEPFFYPVGSEYMFAENTYKMGFKGITAGDWLKEKLNKEYGMKTESFLFSYDKELYIPGIKKDSINRIFFYARPVTPRRAFELGLLALGELHKQIPDIEVIFAGWDLSNYHIPFTHLNAGSVPLHELSDLYSQCDMCVVLSHTNLSLLPLEIMASNSVVVCNQGEHSKWLVDDNNAVIVDDDPLKIADTLSYYLKNKEKLIPLQENGLKQAQSTSWENEIQKVYDFITQEISNHVK